MHIDVRVGDITQHPADILIAGANPWLRLTGGVGAALMAAAGPRVAEEMAFHLESAGSAHLPTGSIVVTSAAPLPFHEAWHVVTVDHKYKAHPDLVGSCLSEILARAEGRHVALSALGTGYGGLEMVDFLLLLRDALDTNDAHVTLILAREDQAELARLILGLGLPDKAEDLPPRPWRVILAVEVLHAWGYQQIRLIPSAGALWECTLTSKEHLEDDGLSVGPSGRLAHFSDGQEHIFGWADAEALAPRHLAALLLSRCPELAEQGRGLDPAYARWFQATLMRSSAADKLPTARPREGFKDGLGVPIAAPPNV